MANVFVFIPSFRGNISSTTFETSHRLMSGLMAKGIPASVGTYSWPDIADLRNMVLSVWYDTMPGSSHLLFVDDDMGFPPELIIDMLTFNEPVVGVIYPKKTTARQWVGSGVEGAEYRPGFIEVEGVGAGVLLIQREAISRMIERYPDLVGDHMVIAVMKIIGAKRTLRFFDCILTPGGKVSEDISFCRRWREIGGVVWASVAYEIQHVGPWSFSGCFAKERDEETKASRKLGSSRPRFGVLSKPMKAYEQENSPPFIGDIRPTIDLPAGTDLDKLTQFEVFNGRDWMPPDTTMMVQDDGKTAA